MTADRAIGWRHNAVWREIADRPSARFHVRCRMLGDPRGYGVDATRNRNSIIAVAFSSRWWSRWPRACRHSVRLCMRPERSSGPLNDEQEPGLMHEMCAHWAYHE